MTAKKIASAHSLGSDLARVDAHKVQASEYDELPELTDQMLARATVNKPVSGYAALTRPTKLILVKGGCSPIEPCGSSYEF